MRTSAGRLTCEGGACACQGTNAWAALSPLVPLRLQRHEQVSYLADSHQRCRKQRQGRQRRRVRTSPSVTQQDLDLNFELSTQLKSGKSRFASWDAAVESAGTRICNHSRSHNYSTLHTLRRAHEVTGSLVIARACLSTTRDVHIVEREVRAAAATTQDVVIFRIRGSSAGHILESLREHVSHRVYHPQIHAK